MVILILVTSPFFPFVTGGRVILKSVDLFINYFFVGYEIPDRKVDNAEIMILRERISDSKRIALTVCAHSLTVLSIRSVLLLCHPGGAPSIFCRTDAHLLPTT